MNSSRRTEIRPEYLERVAKFLMNLEGQNRKRFTASYVAAKLGLSDDVVANILQWLTETDPDLKVRFEIMCPNCHRSVNSFESIEAIPFNQSLECDECEGEIEGATIGKENVWRVYSYNREPGNSSEDVKILDESIDIKKKQILKLTLKKSGRDHQMNWQHL